MTDVAAAAQAAVAPAAAAAAASEYAAELQEAVARRRLEVATLSVRCFELAGEWAAGRVEGRETPFGTAGAQAGGFGRKDRPIRRFSGASRSEFLQRLVIVLGLPDREWYVVTLTTGKRGVDGSGSAADFGTARRIWVDEVHRLGGEVAWRMEAQGNGNPHIHAIVSGVDAEGLDTLASVWLRLSGPGGSREEDRRRHGVRIEPLRVGDSGRLAGYMAKVAGELSKTRQNAWTRGRHWGCSDSLVQAAREAFEAAPVMEIEASHVAHLEEWIEREVRDGGEPPEGGYGECHPEHASRHLPSLLTGGWLAGLAVLLDVVESIPLDGRLPW